jgi:hypothetical protein
LVKKVNLLLIGLKPIIAVRSYIKIVSKFCFFLVLFESLNFYNVEESHSFFIGGSQQDGTSLADPKNQNFPRFGYGLKLSQKFQ